MKRKKKVTSLFSLTLTKRPSGTGRKISTGRAGKNVYCKCISQQYTVQMVYSTVKKVSFSNSL